MIPEVRAGYIKGCMKNSCFPQISRFILKPVQDTAIATKEDEQELVCDLSSGVTFSDLQ